MDEEQIQDINWSWVMKGLDIDPSDVVDIDIVETVLGAYLRIPYRK